MGKSKGHGKSKRLAARTSFLDRRTFLQELSAKGCRSAEIGAGPSVQVKRPLSQYYLF
jgi:hypothetical protein